MYWASVHLRGYFLRQVILGEFRVTDSTDEAIHIRIGDGHRFAPGVAQPAVLQGGSFFHYGVKVQASFMYEKQILYEGHFLADALSLSGTQFVHFRDKNFHFLSFQQFIGRFFGIDPFQVTHHVPLFRFFIPLGCPHFDSRQFYQSCMMVELSINQAVTTILLKSSGFYPCITMSICLHQQ